MPERYGKWQTIYDRIVRRRCDGTLDRVADTLKERPHGEGRIEWDMWCVDGTKVRAAKPAAGARRLSKKGRNPSR